ncbi:MAG: hypothetical protein ABIO36_06550 [Pyrinomonadaceae bacterium]
MKEMLSNGHKKDCEFADEIVSYIYCEVGVAERTVFETHLANCPVCTDEFAAISDARFSIFEWRKEEFDSLSTPQIVIPYAAKGRADEENVQMGLLAGLRGLFGAARLPVTVAALLLLCLGLGFVAMNYLGGDQQLAANVNVPPVAMHNQNTKFPESAIEFEIPTSKIVKDDPVAGKNPNDTGIYSVKTLGNHRPNRQLTASIQKTFNNAPQRNLQNRKAPVLSSYDDTEDKSLRLSDLFDDEVGAKR